MANIFLKPIQTRTEMLTTGFRSVLGIKVFGPDLGTIQNVDIQLEKALTDFPNTRSVFAERTTGGYFLDFAVKRREAARYGFNVGDVNDIIETAIGGKTIATTVEGRERYPVNVRYARDFREDLDALKRVLVASPMNASSGSSSQGMMPASSSAGSLEAMATEMAQIPISALADIAFKTGPPSIRTENAQQVGFVFVDVTTDDIGGYVRQAAERIREQVQFPSGYYIQWAGSFEYQQRAFKRFLLIAPFTLLLIFVLIYLNTRSAIKTAIVLTAVPFSLVGAFWLLYILGYNLSSAVWVGLIALAGLDAETGVVMLLYLDHAWDKFRDAGRLNSMSDLNAAVIEGAVQRIRPKVMTICAILFGLLPIMWSPTTQSGADVMKRIAAPMIGGVITSGILELLLYPVIYVFWRKRNLGTAPARPGGLPTAVAATSPSEFAALGVSAEPKPAHAAAAEPAVPTSPQPTKPSRPRRMWLAVLVFLIVALGAGGFIAWKKFGRGGQSGASSGAPFATQQVKDLTVDFIHPKGHLENAMNEILIEFRYTASGELVDVGIVKFDLDMNMPGM